MVKPRALTPTNTRWQRQKLTVATSPPYSSTALATNPIVSSKRKSTMMPSRARTQSPALMTRFHNWQTSINHCTSPTLPGSEEAVLPLPRKGRQGAQPLHPPHWLPPPRNPWNVNPTLYLARKMTTAKWKPMHRERRTVSTAELQINGLSTAPISPLPNAKNLP